jgi:biopolymer transport protein ExbB
MWELFQLGGPVMWPLLAASIIGLGLILDRVFVFALWHQGMHSVVRKLQPLIASGTWEEAARWCQRRGPLTRMALVYLQQRDQSKEVRDDLIRREGLLVLAHLDRGLRWLAVLAQVSTLLGLLATFHVMIVRFSEGEVGGQMQPASFSSAIWESLLTTMYGLLIAIPCSATYQILEGRVDAIARQIDVLISYLDQWCREAARREETLIPESLGDENDAAADETIPSYSAIQR